MCSRTETSEIFLRRRKYIVPPNEAGKRGPRKNHAMSQLNSEIIYRAADLKTLRNERSDVLGFTVWEKSKIVCEIRLSVFG